MVAGIRMLAAGATDSRNSRNSFKGAAGAEAPTRAERSSEAPQHLASAAAVYEDPAAGAPP
jgi:hypothetical protein